MFPSAPETISKDLTIGTPAEIREDKVLTVLAALVFLTKGETMGVFKRIVSKTNFPVFVCKINLKRKIIKTTIRGIKYQKLLKKFPRAITTRVVKGKGIFNSSKSLDSLGTTKINIRIPMPTIA